MVYSVSLKFVCHSLIRNCSWIQPGWNVYLWVSYAPLLVSISCIKMNFYHNIKRFGIGIQKSACQVCFVAKTHPSSFSQFQTTYTGNKRGPVTHFGALSCDAILYMCRYHLRASTTYISLIYTLLLIAMSNVDSACAGNKIASNCCENGSST